MNISGWKRRIFAMQPEKLGAIKIYATCEIIPPDIMFEAGSNLILAPTPTHCKFLNALQAGKRREQSW